jgi:hypothetical protein
MAVELSFFAHLNANALYKYLKFAEPFQVPPLIQGDTVALSIGLVKDNPDDGIGALGEITITGWSCKAAVGTEGQTPLSSVTLSVVDNRFVGVLPMNTAAIDTLFSGNETQTYNRTFELEFTDSTGTITLKRTVSLVGELITSATVATPSPDTSLGKAEAVNLYIPKSGAKSIILIDQSGAGNDLILWNDGGNFKTDPMS